MNTIGRLFSGWVVKALIGALTALSLFTAGCGSGERKPNILFISMDTVRRDHCSLYGYLADTTPNLTRFAEEGVAFDRAYAPTSTTAPSHATMFTGLYPIAHGLIKNGVPLSDEQWTLAEILESEGYQTAAIAGSFVLHSRFGFAQGFSFYDDAFEEATSTFRMPEWEGMVVEGGFDRRADDVTARVIRWMENDRNPERPFFLFVHYFDPHSPYMSPEPFFSRFSAPLKGRTQVTMAIGRYNGEIAFMDHEMARIFRTLVEMGIDEETICIVTADHGEGLMDHGHMGHSVNIYEEAVRIPLIFRWPGSITGKRIFSSPVELVDLAPTILDLASLGYEENGFQGRSLAPFLLDGASVGPDRDVFLQRRHFRDGFEGKIHVKGEKYGIMSDSWKYIAGMDEGTLELFDLNHDPGELYNVYEKFPDRVADLSGRLHTWMEANTRSIGGTGVEISEEDKAKLRAMGYVD